MLVIRDVCGSCTLLEAHPSHVLTFLTCIPDDAINDGINIIRKRSKDQLRLRVKLCVGLPRISFHKLLLRFTNSQASTYAPVNDALTLNLSFFNLLVDYGEDVDLLWKA